MKTKLFILFLLAITTAASAQFKGFHIGGRFGVGQNNATYRNSDVSPRLSSRLFVSGGVATNYSFNSFLGINTDILISQKSTEYTSTFLMQDIDGTPSEETYRNQINAWYLDVPVTGQLSLRIKDFGIRYYVGPQIGFNLVATENREYDNNVYQEENGYYRQEYRDINTTEIALIQGLGLSVQDKGERIYFLDARFVNGMTHFTKINGNHVYNDNFSLSAGCMF